MIAQLREQAPALGYRYTTPEAFVDLCEQVRGRDDAAEELARQVQRLEWRLWFAWGAGRGG